MGTPLGGSANCNSSAFRVRCLGNGADPPWGPERTATVWPALGAQARATASDLKQLSVVNEQLALAEARVALAATQAARRRRVSSQQNGGAGSYGLSSFGTGGLIHNSPNGNLRPN